MHEQGSRVKVTGLIGDDNNIRGTVKGDVVNGRQQVLLDNGTKMKVKIAQLVSLDKDALNDFSGEELKELLRSKGEDMDSANVVDLLAKANEVCSSEDVATFGKADSGASSGTSEAQLKEMSRKMKLQADQMRKSPMVLKQVQHSNPQMRGMSATEVQEHFDNMANMPLDQLEIALKMQQGGSSALTADETARMAQNQTPEQIHSNMKKQLDTLRKRPAALYEMRKQNPQFATMSREEAISYLEMMVNMPPEQLAASMNGGGQDPSEAMKNMDPEQMSKMMKMQRDMLKKNPEMWEKMSQSNPMMKGLSRDQALQQLDMMADLSPEQLATYTSVAQTAEKWLKPVRSGYQMLDTATFGNARVIMLALLLSFVAWLIDRYIYTLF